MLKRQEGKQITAQTRQIQSQQRNGLNIFLVYLMLQKVTKNKLEGSNKILPDSKYDPILDSPFTIEEILKGIRGLKLKKANGNDSISNEMIIARAPTLLPFLVTFFNEI